jgi:hypothetical protein
MRTLRALSLILALTCAFPSGWTLCVGPDGHLVVEPSAPAGQLCCEPGEARAGDACVPDGCEDCRDYELASDAQLRGRPDVNSADLAPVQIVALVRFDRGSLACVAPFATAQLLAVPPLQTVSLRC